MQDEATSGAADPNSRTNDEEERLEAILRDLDLSQAETDRLRSFTRVLIGGALVGWDELLTHMETWETQVKTQSAEEIQSGVIVVDSRQEETVISTVPPAGPLEDASAEELRYMLIGMLFEAESRFVKRGSAAVDFASQTAESILSPVSRWVNRSKRLRPAREGFETLVQRGERVTEGWVRRGKIEEAHSRRLVRTGTQETFDYSMDQLGQADALQDLVRQQTAGISQEVLEEVRERTVTGDLLLEQVARRILRRRPRATLPAKTDENSG